MGLATAKLLGKEPYHVVISDVDQERLDRALRELEQLGIAATAVQADIANAAAVGRLATTAAATGQLRGVVHTAGVSPLMGEADFIIKVNALGTVNIAEAFLPFASEGFSLVNVASIAGHLLPSFLAPKGIYQLAFAHKRQFYERLVAKASFGSMAMRPGKAYALSKNFVIWYSARVAKQYGTKGARVVSVSPGTFDTSMGRLEEQSGSGRLIQHAALKRYGKPEEVAELLAFLGSGKAGYISGTDILIDGGTRAGLSLGAMFKLMRGARS